MQSDTPLRVPLQFEKYSSRWHCCHVRSDPFDLGGWDRVMGRMLGRETKEFGCWQRWSSSSVLNYSFCCIDHVMAGVGVCGQVGSLADVDVNKTNSISVFRISFHFLSFML